MLCAAQKKKDKKNKYTVKNTSPDKSIVLFSSKAFYSNFINIL